MFRINVGGTIYTTLQRTLIDAGGMLRDIAEQPDIFPQDMQNIPFLDRNPTRFEQILDLCRNNGRPLREKIPLDLLDDVEYLCITTRIPFRFEAGAQIELMNTTNGIANIAWILEVTLHEITIKTHDCKRIRCKHQQIWDGQRWSFPF